MNDFERFEAIEPRDGMALALKCTRAGLVNVGEGFLVTPLVQKRMEICRDPPS